MSSIQDREKESSKVQNKSHPRKAMGRGLAALLGGAENAGAGVKQQIVKTGNSKEFTVEKVEGLRRLPLSKIVANPDQPRKTFNQASIEELAESIKTQGLIQPIIVSQQQAGDPNSDFVIVAGERRWRASKLVGLQEIDVVVRDGEKYSSLDNDLASLIENVQREDLNPVDLAKSYQTIIQNSQITQEELSKHIGRSRVKIANTIRLLRLPEEILEGLRKREFSEGQARALLALESPQQMLDTAAKIRSESLSVRQVEAEVKRILNTSSTKQANEETRRKDSGASSPAKSQELVKAEELLREIFATKVRISGNTKRGTVELYYTSEDSLNRLLHLMKGLR